MVGGGGGGAGEGEGGELIWGVVEIYTGVGGGVILHAKTIIVNDNLVGEDELV